MEAHICKPLNQAIGSAPEDHKGSGRAPDAVCKDPGFSLWSLPASSVTMPGLYLGGAAALVLVTVGAVMAMRGRGGFRR